MIRILGIDQDVYNKDDQKQSKGVARRVKNHSRKQNYDVDILLLEAN